MYTFLSKKDHSLLVLSNNTIRHFSIITLGAHIKLKSPTKSTKTPKSVLVYSMKVETSRATLFDLSWEHTCMSGDSDFSVCPCPQMTTKAL